MFIYFNTRSFSSPAPDNDDGRCGRGVVMRNAR